MKKHTYEFIQQKFKDKNFKLQSTEYINNRSKLDVICPLGHEVKMTYGSFQHGYGCPVCGKTQKLTFKNIKLQFENKNFKLQSTEYVNSWTKLDVICPLGHEVKICWNDFQQGHRCSICAGNKTHDYDFIKQRIEIDGSYLLSTEYINAHTKLDLMCVKKHEYSVTWNNYQQGKRCPHCSNNISKPEIEIQEYVKTLTNNVICNDRTKILNSETNKHLELDVYLPLLNKAIEFNGRYWHSFEDVIQRDKFKQKECERLGIELLVINEQDYIDNKQNQLNKIEQFLK